MEEAVDQGAGGKRSQRNDTDDRATKKARVDSKRSSDSTSTEQLQGPEKTQSEAAVDNPCGKEFLINVAPEDALDFSGLSVLSGVKVRVVERDAETHACLCELSEASASSMLVPTDRDASLILWRQCATVKRVGPNIVVVPFQRLSPLGFLEFIRQC